MKYVWLVLLVIVLLAGIGGARILNAGIYSVPDDITADTYVIQPAETVLSVTIKSTPEQWFDIPQIKLKRNDKHFSTSLHVILKPGSILIIDKPAKLLAAPHNLSAIGTGKIGPGAYIAGDGFPTGRYIISSTAYGLATMWVSLPGKFIDIPTLTYPCTIPFEKGTRVMLYGTVALEPDSHKKFPQPDDNPTIYSPGVYQIGQDGIAPGVYLIADGSIAKDEYSTFFPPIGTFYLYLSGKRYEFNISWSTSIMNTALIACRFRKGDYIATVNPMIISTFDVDSIDAPITLPNFVRLEFDPGIYHVNSKTMWPGECIITATEPTMFILEAGDNDPLRTSFVFLSPNEEDNAATSFHCTLKVGDRIKVQGHIIITYQ